MVTCQSGRPLSFRENRKSDLLSRNKRSTTALTREEDILLSARVIRGVFQGVKQTSSSLIFVYYESMKRKLKIKPICECRCTGRLQTKRLTRLTHWVVPSVKVYFQQIKKKSKTEGKTCHGKTMLSLEKPIKLI